MPMSREDFYMHLDARPALRKQIADRMPEIEKIERELAARAFTTPVVTPTIAVPTIPLFAPTCEPPANHADWDADVSNVLGSPLDSRYM